MNALAQIGHNLPPSPIEEMQSATEALNGFLTDTPVILTTEQAASGALFVERQRKAVQDLEDARKAEVGPLNERVKTINERYRAVREPAENVLGELRKRLTGFAQREEAARQAEARRLADIAAESERAAREAEQREQEAKQNASVGEITNVAAAVIEADQKFSRFKKDDRAAQRAEQAIPVRLPSKLGGNAISMRTKETLNLDDAKEAIQCIGVTDGIRDAILSAARQFRKETGVLPAGVSATHTREI